MIFKQRQTVVNSDTISNIINLSLFKTTVKSTLESVNIKTSLKSELKSMDSYPTLNHSNCYDYLTIYLAAL
jgi:hypothetical protein